MRLVVAVGGNALLKRGEAMSIDTQRRNMAAAATGLARACSGLATAIVHGNGPQVGLLALEAEAFKAAPPMPLDVLGAQSQGMIGYVVAQALRNVCARPVSVVLTQVVVDPADPAFQAPAKPIGPVYRSEEGEALRRRGWSLARDGDGWRRVVGSPRPLEIVDLSAIESLVDAHHLVVCAGGGGVPVRRGEDGRLDGVEAVIDKDLSAALLAERLGADRLVILTDVDAVYAGWGAPGARRLEAVTPSILRGQVFAVGSMGPKVEAVCGFVDRPGRSAAIGALAEAEDVIAGRTGTQLRPD